MSEYRLMLELYGHPNICSVVGCYALATSYCLVMELIFPGEDLHTVRDRLGNLSEHETQHCLRQVLEGLRYMHSKSIAHRDCAWPRSLPSLASPARATDAAPSVAAVKLENVMVKGNSQRLRDARLVIIDFGLSKKMQRASAAPESTPFSPGSGTARNSTPFPVMTVSSSSEVSSEESTPTGTRAPVGGLKRWDELSPLSVLDAAGASFTEPMIVFNTPLGAHCRGCGHRRSALGLRHVPPLALVSCPQRLPELRGAGALQEERIRPQGGRLGSRRGRCAALTMPNAHYTLTRIIAQASVPSCCCWAPTPSRLTTTRR